MLNNLRNTAKHTSVYAFGNIATKVIGLLLIPLYANETYLSHADFGVLAVLEATSQILIGTLTMAMLQSLTRWYWDKEYAEKKKSIFFTTLSFLIAVCVPIGLVLMYFSDQLAIYLLDSESYGLLLKLTIAVALLQIINNQVRCLAKLQSKSVWYSTILIIKLCISLGLTLYGILVLNKGLEAIWWSAFISEGIAFLIQLPYVVKNIEFKFESGILKEMLHYGFPLMLAALSGVMLATVDRYMLSSMSGLERTGVYSMGFRIANTLKVVITTSLALAISPLKMQYINKPNNQRFYSKINTYTAFIFIIALLGISLFSFDLLKLIPKASFYWEAHTIVPIIGYALFFGLIKDNTLIGLTIKKQTKIIGTLIFITSLLNIVLNYLLIPILDIYGASLATVLSQFAFLLMVTHYSQKAYPIPYEWSKIVKLIILSGLFILVGIGISEYNVLLRITIKIGLLVIFPIVLYPLGFYERIEAETLKGILRSWKDPKKFKENIKRILN